MEGQVNYGSLKGVLKMFGINPKEFWLLNMDKLCGWFPDLPDRRPTINVNKLSQIIWEQERRGR